MNNQHELAGLNRIDLNLFRVFEVIYRERNLTRAASLLHLSQSAVSHALARLREQLGDPLFVREGRGVAPTALAEQLAPVIQDSLNGLWRSLGRAQQFDPALDRRLFCLNMPEQMEPLLLPRLCAHLRQVAPKVELRCSSLHWAEVPREMVAGRVDVAVEITRPTDNELRQHLLFSDQFCVLAGAGFRGELTAARYLAAEHVAITSQRRGICAEDLALGHLGLSRNVAQHCRNYLSAALLVAQGELLLTLPHGYAQLLNLGLGNQILPLPVALPPVTLSLYWLRQAEGDAAGAWLRAQLLQLART
jgi:DNA-binding transcriptional LysR family regulator